MFGSESVREEDCRPDLLLMMNLETPPSIEDDVAPVWPPGIWGRPRLDEENVRRAASRPLARVREVLREVESDGLAIAEMEDMAGGALAECEGVRRRFAISPWSAG